MLSITNSTARPPSDGPGAPTDGAGGSGTPGAALGGPETFAPEELSLSVVEQPDATGRFHDLFMDWRLAPVRL